MNENEKNEQKNENAPVETEKLTDPRKIAEEAVKILDSKKAQNIKCLKIDDKTVLADYFVICRGNSNTQIRALSGELEEKMKQKGVELLRMEGFNEGIWTVLDFASVIVHIFDRASHDFYKLDKLWSDAEEIDVSAIIGGKEA